MLPILDCFIVLFFVAGFLWRIFTLVVSAKNERVLKAAGAREYGAWNSRLLRTLHATFYLCAFFEGYWRAAQVGEITFWGVGLYLFSVVILALVWHDLGEIWTVKLYIAPDHRVSRSWLFRTVRHPNYFLNIIPEFVGLGLVLRAWNALSVGLPLLGLALAYRIREEERAMETIQRVEENESSHKDNLQPK